jgi:hypothetical protein
MVAVVAASPGYAQSPPIVGYWRGTSTCVDKVRFPACHDEDVLYDVRAQPGSSDTVQLRAHKIVNGSREFMYELPFVQAADGSWSAEFRNSRVHGRWVVRVTGQGMTGRLLDLPSERVVRRMALRRVERPS